MRKRLLDLWITIACIGAATGVGFLFRFWDFPETNIVVAYILSVLLTARFTTGYRYGIIATIGATTAFNYFFTKPYFTLSVDDPAYFVTFAIMVITSIITSASTSKIMQNALASQESEAKANALYEISNRLTDAKTMVDIANITVNVISRYMNCFAACLCFDENGMPERSYVQQKSETEQVHRKTESQDAIRHRMENLHSSCDMGDEFCDFPIYGSNSILGVVRIPKEAAEAMSDPQTKLLHSMIESTALAMDRFHSIQERMKSREETEQERYRGNLLRAISHDLRTPLSGIMGTSEILMSMTDKTDERYILAAGIYKEADWLHSLVENILNLTRLQDGKLTIHKEPEALEEVIGAAVLTIEKRAPEYEITVHIPDETLFVPMDARLITQVFVNLLDNAVKHTEKGKEIVVTAYGQPQEGQAVFSVMDTGTGIAEADLPHVFQMFYTTRGKQPDAQRGVGLGLAICESIIKAHGGTILARNREDASGAEIRFTLPLEDCNEK